MSTYLEFENKIKQIQEDITFAKLKNDSHAVEILNRDLEAEVKKIYKNLSSYQILQLARHQDRPYSLDYINILLKNSYEIHGDRHFKDDKAIVCFLGYIFDKKVMIIGEEKGRGTKNKIMRNFGMPNPEGYRKALRVAKLAEKFNIPILMLIDTPGAYPGIGAEERNQSEAIAKNLLEFSKLKVPTISIVIGEGGSGGALAIGVCDKFAMMKYSVFSVISPEGCAAILWNDPSKVQSATKAMKVTSLELHKFGLVDDVINEPLVGAHRDKIGASKEIGEYFISSLEELNTMSVEDRIKKRYEKITSYGDYLE